MEEEVKKTDEFLQLITKELSTIMDNKTPICSSPQPLKTTVLKVPRIAGGIISDVEEATPRSKTMGKRFNIDKVEAAAHALKSSKASGAALKNVNLEIQKAVGNNVDSDVQKVFEKSKMALPKIDKQTPNKKASQKQKYKNGTKMPMKEQVSSKSTNSTLDELVSLTSDTENARRMQFVESQASKCIDADLQRMQLDLKQSYDLFQSIGEKFNSIDFSSLRNRISDLHLHNMDKYMKDESTNELHKEFEQSCIDKRLDKLTNKAGESLRRHPGEFGDIPELSAFFQACTQLEHGLDNLKKQREQSNDLQKRMSWATEIAYERMEEIRNAVGNNPTKNF